MNKESDQKLFGAHTKIFGPENICTFEHAYLGAYVLQRYGYNNNENIPTRNLPVSFFQQIVSCWFDACFLPPFSAAKEG